MVHQISPISLKQFLEVSHFVVVNFARPGKAAKFAVQLFMMSKLFPFIRKNRFKQMHFVH
jgi:hypothetical protein